MLGVDRCSVGLSVAEMPMSWGLSEVAASVFGDGGPQSPGTVSASLRSGGVCVNLPVPVTNSAYSAAVFA